MIYTSIHTSLDVPCCSAAKARHRDVRTDGRRISILLVEIWFTSWYSWRWRWGWWSRWTNFKYFKRFKYALNLPTSPLSTLPPKKLLQIVVSSPCYWTLLDYHNHANFMYSTFTSFRPATTAFFQARSHSFQRKIVNTFPLLPCGNILRTMSEYANGSWIYGILVQLNS